jgi:hypothetical protein
LPANDPLFVAEFNPELRKGFESPKLLREFGLILENMDGFEDLENKFVMRVSHTHSLCEHLSILPRGRARVGPATALRAMAQYAPLPWER